MPLYPEHYLHSFPALCSVFGEDALVNVSVEKLPDGRLGGYLRIRWAGGGQAGQCGMACRY